MKNAGKNTTAHIAIAGILVIAIIMLLGTIWIGRSTGKDTEEAAHAVSLLYLEELAGRREQVVASNLQNSIDNIEVAIGLMTEEDLSDVDHLHAYQARMKKLYGLEKFALVNSDGLIYTALGQQNNIADYSFDYNSLSGPEISILNMESEDKKVVIAVPVDNIAFDGGALVACFMEIDMDRMLEGVSIHSSTADITFCNIYTGNGIALSNVVLGGLASEDNLLEAMKHADFDVGYSAEVMAQDFAEGRKGIASFIYDNIQGTLSYTPVEGTDWMLTYLIQESVIKDQINAVSGRVIIRSLVQSILTALVLLGMFAFIISQSRKNTRLILEKETQETESRVKQQELEQRLSLQEKLLEQEKERTQQDSMISALASDYRSVYYVSLDDDEGICYRDDTRFEGALRAGEHFRYYRTFADYAEKYVADGYRDGFLQFIEPDHIRKSLEDNSIIVYRYLIQREGKESYEMIRMAGARHANDSEDHAVHAVGVGFTDIDQEMRESMAKNQALSEALTAAEEANKAKTAFLSNMSHEIRTPMNAIIGLDNIALNEEGVPESTRGYLKKIGDSAEHLLHLINDILDMSRIESGRMTLKQEEFSFPKLLEAINTLFSGQCHEKGIDYQCHIDGHVDDYYIGDDMKLRQVLINILSNAVKFTPEGGKVELTVKKTAEYAGKSTLQFVISDTGIGISKEYLPHIFEAFSQEDSSATNRYGSSGLGMAITKTMVEMMNGNIRVESEKGSGTTFTVTVTLMDSETKDTEAAHGEEDIRPQDMKVLIVEDDPVAMEHGRLVLEKAGIAADTVASGREAVEVVRIHHARRDFYNLILVDWKMPEMDGVETARQIRSITGDESAIIMLTAYKWDDIAEEAQLAGVDSFISKPLFAGVVLDEFRSAARKKNMAVNSGEGKADLTGRRILLAEDMQVNAEIMMMVLQMRQIETDLAENGRIAVEKFASRPEGYYDAILMDMRMPEMDGLEATRRIRDMDRQDAGSIPIIALTANAFDEDVQRSLQAGLNAHLSKPVQPDALFETLESLIKD